LIAAVRQLVLIANDDVIAGILNRNGLVTGHGNRWTREPHGLHTLTDSSMSCFQRCGKVLVTQLLYTMLVPDSLP
jgi:hypothetical protein